jgi:hypothetical protein
VELFSVGRAEVLCPSLAGGWTVVTPLSGIIVPETCV